jgi:hypothetical protein
MVPDGWVPPVHQPLTVACHWWVAVFTVEHVYIHDVNH